MHLWDPLSEDKGVQGTLHPTTLREMVQTGAGWDLNISEAMSLFLSIRKVS